MQCTLCILFYALYSMHCIICTVFYALYSMHCIICIVFYVLFLCMKLDKTRLKLVTDQPKDRHCQV